MKFFKTLIILFITGILLIGCSSTNEDSLNAEDSNETLTIYTTVYPLQYIVEEIGGETVMAYSVYPPGADGHTYEPTSKEMTEFAKSDAFIYIGEGMEGFAESISGALETQDVALIEIGKYEEVFQKAGHSDDDHAHENDEHGEHAITIEGLSDHYHTEDAIKLTANHSEESEHDHWHWFILSPDVVEWEIVEGQSGDTYEAEATISEQQIKAVQYDDNHEIITESQPVTIVIDDHEGHDHDDEEHDHGHEGHNDDHEGVVTIEGLARHYHTGDPIKLTANPSEDSEHDHWHWFTLAIDSEEWEVVEGQSSNTYEGEATISGQQIKAALYDDNHEIIAESDPEIITIDDHMEHDPHIWTDPLRVIQVAEIIKDELIALNPSEESLYNENLIKLKSKLIDLDEKFIKLLEKKENKYMIVPHEAFGYWEERYGVKQIAISGLSSGEEPSQKELTEVIKVADEYDVEYILYEQNSGSRLSKVIQDEIGAEALTIHNLEVRTEEDIENKEDYISLMEYNLEILDQVTK